MTWSLAAAAAAGVRCVGRVVRAPTSGGRSLRRDGAQTAGGQAHLVLALGTRTYVAAREGGAAAAAVAAPGSSGAPGRSTFARPAPQPREGAAIAGGVCSRCGRALPAAAAARTRQREPLPQEARIGEGRYRPRCSDSPAGVQTQTRAVARACVCRVHLRGGGALAPSYPPAARLPRAARAVAHARTRTSLVSSRAALHSAPGRRRRASVVGRRAARRTGTRAARSGSCQAARPLLSAHLLHDSVAMGAAAAPLRRIRVLDTSPVAWHTPRGVGRRLDAPCATGAPLQHALSNLGESVPCLHTPAADPRCRLPPTSGRLAGCRRSVWLARLRRARAPHQQHPLQLRLRQRLDHGPVAGAARRLRVRPPAAGLPRHRLLDSPAFCPRRTC